MEDDTPRDPSLPDFIAPEPQGYSYIDGVLSTSLAMAVPLARPAGASVTSQRTLEDVEIFLFPLSRGQAIADVGLIFLLAFLCDLVIGFSLAFIVPLLYDIPLDGLADIPPHVQKEILFPMLAVRAATSIGLVTAFLWGRGQTSGAIGLRKRGLAIDGALGFALTFAVYGLILAMLGLFYLVQPQLVEQLQENASGLHEMIPKASPLAFLLMALTIGVYEEVVFRGFLMPRLRRATGSWLVAVILSSAVFTALHAMEQTPAALVFVAILSVSFSVVTIWRRSIVPAIIAHALFDFSQFLLLMYGGSGQS